METQSNTKTIFNKYQKATITADKGAYLVEAGPGSGKTRVITERMARLIREGTDPNRILMLTFTVAAAQEMATRVASMTNGMKPEWILNFHRFCTKLLREDCNIKLKVLDEGKAMSTIWKLLFQMEKLPKDVKPGKVAGAAISILEMKRWAKTVEIMDSQESKIELDERELSNNILTGSGAWSKLLERYGETLPAQNSFNGDLPDEIRFGLQVADRYENYLRLNNMLDFDLIIYRTVWELKSNPNLAKTVRAKWDYVQVDEGHDTDLTQFCLTCLINPCNIMWIADPNQSIYGFRGARYYISTMFADVFSATILPLPVNYRSNKEIVDASNKTLKQGVKLGQLQAIGKKQMTSDRGPGGCVEIQPATTAMSEAKQIVEEIGRLLKNGESPKDIAILYRFNSMSLPFEMYCEKSGIQYFTSGCGFWTLPDNKYLTAALKVFNKENDVKAYIVILKYAGRAVKEDVFDNVSAHPEDLILSDPSCYGAATFLRSLQQIRMRDKILREKFLEWLEESGFLQKFAYGEDQKAIERRLALGAVLNAISNMGSIDALLKIIPQNEDVKKEINKETAITMSTIHSAKGLEWKYVFMIGQAEEYIDTSEPEERRVFYVGVTRARDRLVLSYPQAIEYCGQCGQGYPAIYLTEMGNLAHMLPIVDDGMSQPIETLATISNKNTKLQVPYAEKDNVKRLGARWNPDEKTWYVPAGVDTRPFTAWIVH